MLVKSSIGITFPLETPDGLNRFCPGGDRALSNNISVTPRLMVIDFLVHCFNKLQSIRLLHCFGVGKDLIVGHVQSNSAKSICTDTIQRTVIEFVHLMKKTNGTLSKRSSGGMLYAGMSILTSVTSENRVNKEIARVVLVAEVTCAFLVDFLASNS